MLVVDLRVRRELRMDLLATWSTAVQSARRQAPTLRRPDTTIPILDDDEVPSEQPWHRQLRRDNDGSDEYDEQSGYDPSEYDDDDVTLGGDVYPAKEQQRSATLVGNSYVTEERHRSATLSQRSSKDQALWWAIPISQRSNEEQRLLHRLWSATTMSQRSSKDLLHLRP